MQLKHYKNGHTIFERIFPSGMYEIKVYIGTELHDKIRCDDYRVAREYLRSFNKIAKNA